ncbi:MAG: substrate-binding domain-containing protein [Anaerolineae bacterium]|jgi:ribose transport system substrate-binding protein|nr:substrate-binding domain-containing protein [Anaerolineae bacterium]
MKAGKRLVILSLVVIATLLLGACAAPAPQVVEKVVTQVVEKEKVVEKVSTQVVEVEKVVEKVSTQVVEKVVEKQVEVVVTPTPGAANPYRPEDLFKLADELKAATAECAPPAGAKYALLTNAVAPFWTAAQTGASRASSEINVPITFMFPTAAEKLSQQISMLETFVSDKYNAITFSAIDRDAPKPIIEKAVEEGIQVLTTDSDATGSERLLYIGMSDYDAGVKAGEAAKKIIGKGKVVGLVGYATAQNAQDRIAGVKDAFEGSELELVEVMLDDIKPEVSLSNAQTAMQKYPDLAGFVTFYSYNGPTACQAVKQAGKTGEVKIVAFDAEPETQRCTAEGVVQAMIGQRVYFYGYLSGLVMHSLTCNGAEETMKLLDPYLYPWPTKATATTAEGAEGKIHLNTGIDVIEADTFALYQEYLNSIGIPSQ